MKVDKNKVIKMLQDDVKKSVIAKKFGVTVQTIYRIEKEMKVDCTKVVSLERANQMTGAALDTVGQMQTINEHATWLLEHVMKWIKGDEEAIQVLESSKRKINVGTKKKPIWIEEYKFKDPHEIALKAMAEIRSQLALQLDIFQALYDVKAAQEFQKEVLEAIGEVDPDVRKRIIDRLAQRRAIRSAISLNQR